MSCKDLISVVIPVYNGEKFIEETINSLKKQTYTNFEVVLVDDCSKDNSVEVIKNLIKDDSRFRLFVREENQGNAVKNIEWSIQHLNGEWFFYMSHDDLIDEDFFEKCLDKAHQTGSDCVLPNMLYYYPNTPISHMDGTFPLDRNYNLELSNIEAFKMSLDWRIHAFHLKRMSIVKKLPWNSHLLAGDEILNRMYFYYSNKIVYVDTNFYYNIENEQSITQKVKPSLCDFIECALILSNFAYQNKAVLNKTYKDYFKYTLKLLKQYRRIFENNYLNLKNEEKEEIDKKLSYLRKQLIDFSIKIQCYQSIFKIIKYSKIRKKYILKKIENSYVVIFSNLPNKNNLKDGMVQRELAIDSELNNFKRVYIGEVLGKIKFHKQPRKFIQMFTGRVSDKYQIEQFKTRKVRIYEVIDYRHLNSLLKHSNKIYVHSILSLKKIPIEFIEKYSYKMILDIHGCVVEEFKFYKDREQIISQYAQLEYYFRRFMALVAVSNQMIEFYKSKYPEIRTRFINLPIFSSNLIENQTRNYDGKLNIVYSGGSHKWQNVDLMVETINKIIDDFDITILTPDIEIFKDKLSKYNIQDKVTIKQVEPNMVKEEYKKAHLGFILRDDIIVNKVACPTKLVEYLSCGVIPIVLQPEIGDFNYLGYSYILNDDLVQGKIPDKEALKQMCENNYRVIEKLQGIQAKGKRELERFLLERR